MSLSLSTNYGEQIQSKQFSLSNNISTPISDGVDKQFKIKTSFDNNTNGEILWSYNYKLAQGMETENPPESVKSYGLISLDSSRSLNSMNMQVLQQAHPNTNKAIVGEYLTNVQLETNARQFKSVNGQHVLVSKVKADPSQWKKYAWDVYDTNSQLIGSMSNVSSYSPFIVSGQTIVFISQPNSRVKNSNWVESPLTLQAVSLDSGSTIWDKEVRDLKFKGPYPH